MSKLHFILFSKWDAVSEKVLETVLNGIDYFITPEGNAFLGLSSFEEIQDQSLCMQAHSDHPGGHLMFDRENNHMYAKFYGHRKSKSALIGRKFGVFKVGEIQALKYIEVEHCSEGQGEALTLFFEPDQHLMDEYLTGELLIHYGQEPELRASTLSCWALDDLLNVAIIIEKLKNYCQNKRLYGLITVNEEVGHLGLKSSLGQLKEKKLFYLNMDVIDASMETEKPYGIRRRQEGIRLDQFIPKELISEFGQTYFADLKYGSCEGRTLITKGERALCLYVKIMNLHNGIMNRKFTAEMIEVDLMKDYLNFIDKVIGAMRENLEVIHKVEKRNSSASFSNEVDITLNKSRGSLVSRLDEADINAIKLKLIAEIEEVFYPIPLSRLNINKSIEIREVTGGNFNACTKMTSHPHILLSVDRIPEDNMKRVLTHEMIHRLLMNFWQTFLVFMVKAKK